MTKEQFPEILLFPTRIIEEKFKIYPHILEKKGILWSYYVSIFFKTSILSTIFVYLSAERWRFSALFQISKNSISATFSTRFPSACPPPMIGASFAHNVPTQIPCASPVFCSFRGNLRKRIPTQIPAHSPSNPPFQGEPTVDFLEKTVIFLEFDTF